MKLLAEKCNFKNACLPVDMNTAAITGERIKMDKGGKLAIVVSFGDSVAAVVTPSFQQHTLGAAGVSKDLLVAKPYFVKAGAATKFTKVDITTPVASIDLSADFAAAEGLAVFEVLPEELDLANGYAWASINFLDSTAAKIVAAIYVVDDCKFEPAYSTDL